MDSEKVLPQELVEQFVISAHGNLDRVKQLHSEEPALLTSTWEKFNETALQASSHVGNRAIAEYLLAQGATLDVCAAAMLGRAEDVAALLAQDPALATAKGAHGITVMYHAALSGRPEVAELLVLNGGGEGRDHALHAATNFGHTEMVRWLLEHGADNVNVANFEGKTPLKVAIERGHEEIEGLLRARGGTE